MDIREQYEKGKKIYESTFYGDTVEFISDGVLRKGRVSVKGDNMLHIDSDSMTAALDFFGLCAWGVVKTSSYRFNSRD